MDAALAVVGAKSDSTVLVDQTVMGVPSFAFRAFTGMRRGDTTLIAQMDAPLRELNAIRVPVPRCMADSLGWRTIADSTLLRMFRARDQRWPAFREAYPATPRFALVSRPIVTGDTATIYVAIASDEVAGKGMIIRLVRDASGRWIRQADVVLWVS